MTSLRHASALVSAALVLGACLDLDELRDRAAEDAGTAEGGACEPRKGGCFEGAPAVCTAAREWRTTGPKCEMGCVDGACDCEGDPRSVRIWTLHLGQSDSITLKNPTECPIELGGLQLFFDDNEERFMGMKLDCRVALPAFKLQAHAEVRVREDPREGDIDFVANTIDACDGDFSFNPERGGVSYLCDGECDADSVIDMVVHAGEDYGGPGPKFGLTFDDPLSGVTVEAQDAGQYRRVALTGVPPVFHGSDYALETRRAYAGFEEKVEVELDGTAQDWMREEGQTATFATSTESAVGSASLSLRHRGSDGRSAGLLFPLREEGNAPPSYVSYFTRVDTLPASAAYFELTGNEHIAIQASFQPTGLGTELANGERTEVLASEKSWYQVELRNIDWQAHEYDLYVDRVLIRDRVPFWSHEFSPDRLVLYSNSSASVAFWDEIEIWH